MSENETDSDNEKEIPDLPTPEAGSGDFIATKPGAAATFGGVRHICKQTGSSGDKPTYSSLCNRKKAPKHIVGRSLEFTDAHELLLNKVELCKTCRKQAGVDNFIDWMEIQRVVEDYNEGRLARGNPDGDRIPVRAAFAVEVDFPSSAKQELLGIARDILELGGSMQGLPPIEVDSEADDVDFDEDEAEPIEVEADADADD